MEFGTQLKLVLRRLIHAPMFTVITLITLAAGVGANTVVFSVLEGVLLKPLPYPHAEELIGVWHTAPGINLKELNAALRLGRPGPSPDPATLAERSDLFQALRKLPPKQAAAIVLRHHHGYTNREIAAALDIPERTVASRLAAAKERLRKVLANDRPSDSQIDLGTLSEDSVPSD